MRALRAKRRYLAWERYEMRELIANGGRPREWTAWRDPWHRGLRAAWWRWVVSGARPQGRRPIIGRAWRKNAREAR